MNEKEEQIYILGETEALKTVICLCQNKLRGLDVKLKTKEEFDQERIDVINLLRQICSERGDNDWPDDLHICDIMNKHIDWNHV